MDLMHARFGGFGAGTRQQNISDDSACRDIADMVDVFGIKFHRNSGGELPFDGRDTV